MFNPAALQQATLQKLEEAAKQQAMSNNNKNYEDSLFKIAFLPEGNHQIRIIPDINSNLSHLQYVHNIGKRNKCRRATYQDPIDSCPVCKMISEAEEKEIAIDYKMKRTGLSKALIYLINTDKPTEYWKPGTFYVVIQSNKRLNDAIIGVLTMISNAGATNPDAWKIFDPTAEGQPSFELQVVMGQTGKVTLQTNMYSPAPALDLDAKLGDKKLPDLSEIYISDKQTNDTTEEEALKQLQSYVMQHVGATIGASSNTTPPPAQPTEQSTTANVAQQTPTVNTTVEQPNTTQTTVTETPASQPATATKACIGQFNVMNPECNACDVKQQCVTLIMSRNNGGN